jgi:CubicO group peptidase (beta-lactamase class C family)
MLCHTAGVPGLPPGTTPDDLCDWERICALLADAEPWWRPGTRFGYHSDTFGYLVGETVRRATGCTISELLRDLITSPLGIADEVHFGIPARLLPRVATQIDPEGPQRHQSALGPGKLSPDAVHLMHKILLISVLSRPRPAINRRTFQLASSWLTA